MHSFITKPQANHSNLGFVRSKTMKLAPTISGINYDKGSEKQNIFSLKNYVLIGSEQQRYLWFLLINGKFGQLRQISDIKQSYMYLCNKENEGYIAREMPRGKSMCTT